MELKQGTQLQGGRYVIGKVLGQGGFGITYSAVQTTLDAKVAIKEFFMKELHGRDESTSKVFVGSAGSSDLVERFRLKFIKEARNIYRLKHKNIISVIDVFEENGTAYYVMEYLEGGSLADKVKSGALRESDALRYIRQVASALDFIHGKQMMHLDVKPANILLDGDGNAVLIDFGLAKQYDSEGEQTSTTPVGISHGYAPMEQYKRGGVSHFSPATDIYSLGATLFKLVTGDTPPEASDVMNDGLPEISANVSQKVKDALVATMQFRVKERPQSIDEFLLLLDFKSESTGNRVQSTDESDGATVVGHFTSDSKTEIVVEVDDRDEFCTRTYNVNGVEFKMIAVEGGEFQMGATSEQQNPDSDEKPVHSVTLSNYYIGETLVTKELWKSVTGNNPFKFMDGKNVPVDSVDYIDCVKFVEKLNSLLSGQLPNGRKFRLPTEAEWEFAARGGNRSNGFLYAGSNNADDVAWYNGNSGSVTHPVKQKHANELGLFDMSGNLWEWCNDWYEGYEELAQKDPKGPKGPARGSGRVIRGGWRGGNAQYCRVASRSFKSAIDRSSSCGLRLAL